MASLLATSGMHIEDIARLVGAQWAPAVLEAVYRRQIQPVMMQGATAMDAIFPEQVATEDASIGSHAVSHSHMRQAPSTHQSDGA
jgi:hypothetical protein